MQMLVEGIFPCHAIVETSQPVLRVGRINGDEEEVGKLECDDASFVVVFLNAEPISDVQRLMSAVDSRSRVAFFLGIVPIRLIARKL